jgi:hypothetical protein
MHRFSLAAWSGVPPLGGGAQLGLEKVVDETSRILPDLAKEAFLSAQEVSFAIKVGQATASAQPRLRCTRSRGLQSVVCRAC